MNEESIRIDKWLKIARFYKQRQKAAEAVESGKVRLNGERTKPGKLISPGDEITVKRKNRYLKFEVKGISFKSLSASDARQLYSQLNPAGISKELSETAKLIKEVEALSEPDSKNNKKPTKKDRRILNKYKYMLK